MTKFEEWLRKKFVLFFYGRKYNYEKAYAITRNGVINEIYKITDEIGEGLAKGDKMVEAAFKLEVANAIDYDNATIEAVEKMVAIAEKLAYYKFLKRRLGRQKLIETSIYAEEKAISRIFFVAVEKCKERGLIDKSLRASVRKRVTDENGNVEETVTMIENTAIGVQAEV